MTGRRWTDSEIRGMHRSYFAAGLLLAAAAAWLDLWPAFAGYPSLQAAGKAGYVLAIGMVGGAWAHRRWCFHPDRAFRRELGRPGRLAGTPRRRPQRG